jgi:hypothetical protein
VRTDVAYAAERLGVDRFSACRSRAYRRGLRCGALRGLIAIDGTPIIVKPLTPAALNDYRGPAGPKKKAAG